MAGPVCILRRLFSSPWTAVAARKATWADVSQIMPAQSIKRLRIKCKALSFTVIKSKQRQRFHEGISLTGCHFVQDSAGPWVSLLHSLPTWVRCFGHLATALSGLSWWWYCAVSGSPACPPPPSPFPHHPPIHPHKVTQTHRLHDRQLSVLQPQRRDLPAQPQTGHQVAQPQDIHQEPDTGEREREGERDSSRHFRERQGWDGRPTTPCFLRGHLAPEARGEMVRRWKPGLIREMCVRLEVRLPA